MKTSQLTAISKAVAIRIMTTRGVAKAVRIAVQRRAIVASRPRNSTDQTIRWATISVAGTWAIALK